MAIIAVRAAKTSIPIHLDWTPNALLMAYPAKTVPVAAKPK